MLDARYSQKAFETFFLPRLSTQEVNNIPKDKALLVLHIGAVEQHGKHLPVFTDTLIGEGLLMQTFEKFSTEDNIWLLPSIPYGKSTEHSSHPGTFSLSAATLQSIVMDIGKSAAVSGFRRLLILNTHGGNNDLLNMMARDIREETGLMVFRLNPHSEQTKEWITEQEASYGIHGGDVETSMVLCFKENWVDMNKADKEFLHEPEKKTSLNLKGNRYFAWKMDDISKTGIAGDATKATKEKGDKINKAVSEELAGAMLEMADFEIEQLIKP
ncbi:creatinine amidohydrolase/NitT/TauT family transport system ATP-binding protein [Sinobaca qinghaiensis]|uniref:Creatinine amidohydrolase/NitT/TauT family transport system ATP-binding protein n=1 Tax=Sinobaca qinghaiensis TaxID=342944 RepID=A0A419V7P8_9BACL|nr:creatininase family protein [Sinobaca qinghaiensis]RKD76146.1 creatinine amidohydrolase/NitT/TauT family transport system ATP-binding protein [Sinobaca qinghaiensis]